jgi:hypothetical protein
MVSNDVASERCEGSLVFLKSHIRFLNDSRPLSISVFVFGGWGLGLGLSSLSDGGFKFFEVQAP